MYRKIILLGGEAIAQPVKCLVCKHEDLSSNRQYPCKKPGVTERACNLSTGEVETGGSRQLAGQSSQLVSSRFNE